jgi:hypothetical protein
MRARGALEDGWAAVPAGLVTGSEGLPDRLGMGRQLTGRVSGRRAGAMVPRRPVVETADGN